ncbi:hypothetical protein [Planomonospora parontospora]|uniref:hypothetical protein n=1 Tax=Planomonospora parontospora TaxID=58119 RepID=UPI001670982A|nr:hypothetical protein [Planomonospora parontospora]GGL45498.1 hypothetical protein GCM10014719_53490 [Planomonospora parontospora subsp. antibiotica]GII18632.1 hypothetical protein Ppa05_53580 [Planomonospora parontospora subsp. antibiotica]
MTDGLEENLHAALRRAAERAPRAPGALSSRVAARSRRRRARAQALVAAAAVAVVAGGTGLAVRGAGGGSAPPVLSPSPAASAETAPGTPSPAALPEPVEKVWPQAVWKIPARLPGVGKIHPEAIIDDRTLLLTTEESFEKASAIHAYDLDTGQTRKIADIRTPKGVFASGFRVGEGRIVWQTVDEGSGGREGTKTVEFWSVPVGGGEPEAVTTDRPLKGRSDQLAVAGGKLAFSLWEGGVFTVPLGGGTVEPVPGADRHHILSWPWVGTPGDHTSNGEPSFGELLNAETGETSRAVVRPGERGLRCGVTTCTGGRGDGTRFRRSRDGSQERDLPPGASAESALDRFYIVNMPRPSDGEYLYDQVTGRSGDLGLRGVSLRAGTTEDRMVTYPFGKKHMVIDLERIAEGS